MPHFYFDVRDDGTLVADDEGIDLPDLQSAQEEAARTLAEIIRNEDSGFSAQRLALEVRDASRPVFRLGFQFVA